MNNMIKANLARNMSSGPRIVWYVITVAVLMATLIITRFANPGDDNVLGALQGFMDYMGVTVGLITVIGVFSDELRAHAMQAALGLGISRDQAVTAKYIEFIITALVNVMVLCAVGVVTMLVLGVQFTSDQLLTVVLRFVSSGVHIIATGSVAICTVFLTQKITVPIITFFVLEFGLLGMVFSLIELIPALSNLSLYRFTLTGSLVRVQDWLVTGTFDGIALLTAAAWMVLGFVLSILAFRKRELEF